MLLLDADSRERAESLAENAETHELSTNAPFAERYIEGMGF